MKRTILILLLIVVVAGGWYAYKLYTDKVPSLTEVKSDVTINAVDLISAFETDSASGNKMYLGKVIIVTGTVKAIDGDGATLVLGDPGNSSSVRCSMDSTFIKTAGALNLGSTVSLKGACTGFIPDETGFGLGSDVVLNRCVFYKKN